MATKSMSVIQSELSEVPVMSEGLLAHYKEHKAKSEIYRQAESARKQLAKGARMETKLAKGAEVKAKLLSMFDQQAPWYPLLPKSAILRRRLGPFMSAPSKATAAKLRALTQEIQVAFEAVESSQFLKLEFLNQDIPLLVALKQFNAARMNPIETLIESAEDRVFQLIQSNNLVEAFVWCITKSTHISSIFQHYIQVANMSVCRMSLAVAVFESTHVSLSYQNGASSFTNYGVLTTAFDASIPRYEKAVLLVEEFLSLSWCEDQAKAAKVKGDNLWLSAMQSDAVITKLDYLEQRDFSGLLDYADAIATRWTY
jgi:hypothetical protein